MSTNPFAPLVDAIADAVVSRLESQGPQITPRMYSVKQAAIYLGRSEAAIRLLAQHGKLPTVPMDSRLMFDVQDLDRMIEEVKVRKI